MEEFTQKVIAVIKSIPKGKVASYGQVGTLAGKERSARQVVRILHTQSRKHKLPWHRVVNSQLKVSLTRDQGDLQRRKLEAEGVGFRGDKIEKRFHWQP